jgi:hypothetical protein
MIKFFFLSVIFLGVLYPQTLDMRGSMGINLVTTPSLRDYINQIYRTGPEIGTFNTAINFSAEPNYYFNKSAAAGIEVAYVLNSFNFLSDFGRRELTTMFIMPTLTVYYVLSGAGYNFKFGGGAGYRLSVIEEKFSLYTQTHNVSGFGFLLKTDGNTLLSGDLYANIGADIRYDINGNFTAGRNTNIEVDLASFSVGLRLGLTYFIF